MRWDAVDLDREVLSLRSAIAQDGSRTWEKGTKTHQQRRITLDATTVGLLVRIGASVTTMLPRSA